jgi:hypothetical protein
VQVPDNHEKFLHAVTTDDEFRKALRDKNWDGLSQALDRHGINVADKPTVIEAIRKVDWGELHGLEKRLTGRVYPDN